MQAAKPTDKNSFPDVKPRSSLLFIKNAVMKKENTPKKNMHRRIIMNRPCTCHTGASVLMVEKIPREDTVIQLLGLETASISLFWASSPTRKTTCFPGKMGPVLSQVSLQSVDWRHWAVVAAARGPPMTASSL